MSPRPLRKWRPAPLGIRSKVVGIALGITVLLMLFTILYVRGTLRSHLGRQLDHRTVSITRDVAARSVEPILTGNVFDLHRLAYQTLENNPDVVYVFFLDNTGRILAHTFKEYFPSALLEVDHDPAGDGHSLRLFRTEEGILRDVAVPVFMGPDPEATARVGLIDYSLQEALATATPRLVAVSAIIFLVSSVIIYFLVTISAIRPLNSLLRSVQAVTPRRLPGQVTVNSGDELTTLARAFSQMMEQLAHTQQARDRLVRSIIHSQEDERRRIARELHDETGQMLNSLMISLRFLEEAADPQDLRLKTAEFRQLLLQSLEQVRRLAWTLTPGPLADLGLKAALESLVKQYRAAGAISLRIEGLDHRRLPPEVELTLYRVTQEALTNIARHARAQKVGLILNCQRDRLLAVIDDDGIGFDPESRGEEAGPEPTLGLVFMEERLSLVGGRLAIESGPGQGTILYIDIPLPPDGGGTDP